MTTNEILKKASEGKQITINNFTISLEDDFHDLYLIKKNMDEKNYTSLTTMDRKSAEKIINEILNK